MKAPVRYLLWTAGAAIALLCVMAVALYVFYPKEKIIEAVIPRIEAALHREVTLADAGISVWPPFGVYLRGLRVRNRPEYSQEFMMTAEYARASVEFWPLLTGTLAFGDVELTGFHFDYESTDDSTSNVSDILGAEGETPAFLIQRFRLSDASLAYRDVPAKTELDLQGISAEFAADPRTGAFTASLSLGAWKWHDDGEVAGGDDAVRLQCVGLYQAATQTLRFREVSGAVWSLPLTGSAAIDFRRDPGDVSARLQLGPVDMVTLLEQLPESRRELLGSYELSGDLRGDVVWEGALGGEGALPISGEWVWLRGKVVDRGVVLSEFDALSVPFDTMGFHVTGQAVQLLGGAMQLGALATGMPPDKYEITASGQVDLARVAAWTGMTGLSGGAGYSVSLQGRPDHPAGWSVKVRAEADGIQVVQEGKVPLTVGAGVLTYDGQAMRIDRLQAKAGASRFNVRGSVSGVELEALMDDSVTVSPKASLEITSPYCDVDAFFPELPPDTAKPAEVASSPPPLAGRVTARIAADTLIVGGARWNAVRGRIDYRDGLLKIDTLRGTVYGGAATISGTIDLSDPAMPEYHVAARADSVEVAGALSRFTGMSRHLQGRSDLAARVDGRGTDLRDLLDQLTVDGTAQLFDARLVDFVPASNVMGLLGLAPQENVPFRSLRNAFRVEKGRVSFEDFRFTALQSEWSLSGSAGLDGSLDYGLAAVLSKEISDRVKLPEGAVSSLNASWLQQAKPLDLLKNDAGQVEVAFVLRGPYSQPQVGLDWDRMLPLMKSRFEARTTDKLKDKVEEKAKEGLKGLFDKFKR